MQAVKETLNDSNRFQPNLTEHLSTVQETFGDSVVINDKRKIRPYVDITSLGARIDELANRDSFLSKEQQELSRLELKGFPRLVRGVAGSGKTVVLANMVARFLIRRLNADSLFQNNGTAPRIAAVCFNRALVPFIGKKITASFHHQMHREIPTGAIKVKHLNGLMWDLTQEYPDDIKYVPISAEASQRAIQYMVGLESFEQRKPDLFQAFQFDAIFLDEGQDLVPEEYQLLLKLVKTDTQTGEKNLIIFYDDAQNLYGRTRPKWKEIGIDVKRGDRSRVMKECFRNPKEVIELGFNVMLGKQAPDSKTVKMRTYADVNMLQQQDLVEEYKDHFRVKFTKRLSGNPIVIPCSNRAEEKERIASEVIDHIYEGQVRPDDILILFDRIADYENLDTVIKSKDKRGLIQGFVKPYGSNRQAKDKDFFQENRITLSTIKGAKGHDAYLVFLLGADLFETDRKDRASFYVGATRAKMGLVITGVRTENNLLDEALKLVDIL